MDIEANKREQLELAKEIQGIENKIDGEPTRWQSSQIYHAACRLAELVIAANEWESRK